MHSDFCILCPKRVKVHYEYIFARLFPKTRIVKNGNCNHLQNQAIKVQWESSRI